MRSGCHRSVAVVGDALWLDCGVFGAGGLVSTKGGLLQMSDSKKTRLSALKIAASATVLGLAAGLGAGSAAAQEAPTGYEVTPNIVPNNTLSPNQPPPTGVLDS